MFATRVTSGHKTVAKVMTEVRRQYVLGGSAHKMIKHLHDVSENQRKIYYQKMLFNG